MEGSAGHIHWYPILIREMNDWELDIIGEFFLL